MSSNCDVQFIQTLLRKYECDGTINISKITTSPACEKGENFMSVVLRLNIIGKRKHNNQFIDYSTSLVIKRPYKSELLQEAYNSNEIFLNEVIAYNEIIPAMKKISKLKLPVGDCLYADKNLIVLEDLAAEGFEMRRNEVSMSTEQCVAVVQELAVFHAASIILKKRKPEKIEALSKQIMEIFRHDNEAIVNLVDKNLAVALTLLRSLEPTLKVKKAIDTIEKHKEKVYQRVCDLISARKDTCVFNHGDCWRNNILFRTTPNGIKVKLIDLQIMRYTSIAADLNYFLHINLIPEERNKNMDLFLESYIKTLQRCLKENGMDLDNQIYTKNWLETEMSDFAIFGFMCSLWISPAFYFDKHTLPDMESLKPEELDGDYHKNFILKHMTKDLKDRIISLVLDFVNKYTF